MMQSASRLLAYCNMRTLYLRNVPDDVITRLERLAADEGMSVGALALRELSESSKRADNAGLLRSLPDLQVSTSAIVANVEAGRAER
jgi:plasmid stability protein